MTVRLPDGITMEPSHIETLQIACIIKQARWIHILPKIKTSPLISLRVLCHDGCTITLDTQNMSVQTNRQEIINGTRNKKTEMCEVPLETQ